jgi:molybdate transport system substrate-binding protein
VPIGIYAKQYLEGLKLWELVAGKIVPTENVRAALAAVEAGNADATIVYKTDARISRKVRIVFEVPAETGPRISYPMAIVKATRKRVSAERVLAHLSSEEGGKVFTKYGFIVKSLPK